MNFFMTVLLNYLKNYKNQLHDQFYIEQIIFVTHLNYYIFIYIYKSEKKLLPYFAYLIISNAYLIKCISYNFIYIRVIKNVVFHFFFNTNINTSFLFTIQKMINPQFEVIIIMVYFVICGSYISELIN